MKAGIIVFPGTNCDVDTKRACEFFGWETDYIWHDENYLMNYDIVFLPGGFSYGDYIRAGILTKFSPAVFALQEFVEKQRGIIVGICNGFQILCESNLLPGSLSLNSSTRFICKETNLEIKIKNSTKKIKLPIAHSEGKFYAPAEVIEKIKKDELVFLNYIENPNGSLETIAGLYDRKNRILGMMPHPERAVFKETGNTDGRYFFEILESELK